MTEIQESLAFQLLEEAEEDCFVPLGQISVWGFVFSFCHDKEKDAALKILFSGSSRHGSVVNESD